MNRDQILTRAGRLVSGQRDAEYGHPAINLARIGQLWAVILGHPVEAHEVALCLAMVKAARLIANPGHQDSWVDMAGYAAIGGEVSP